MHTMGHIFHNTDWHIVGIDSFRHKGWADRVEVYLKDHPQWRERLTLITHDLVAPFSPLEKQQIGHVDYIIAMASLSDVEASIHDPVYYIKNNVDIALTLLEFAREVKPEVFILISTDEVYGAVETKHDDKCKEWAPILPSNPYAASKACQEAIAISYWRTYEVPLIIVNSMNNFSQFQQPNKYPVIVQKAVANGDEIVIHGDKNDIGSRSYIHSRNFADALIFLLQNTIPYRHQPNACDRPDRYNVAGDKQLDNLELAQLIAELMGKELKYKIVDAHSSRPGHDKHYGLDDSKIRALGWKSPVSFEQSLKETIEWQAAHPDWINV